MTVLQAQRPLRHSHNFTFVCETALMSIHATSLQTNSRAWGLLSAHHSQYTACHSFNNRALCEILSIPGNVRDEVRDLQQLLFNLREKLKTKPINQ